MQQTLFIVFCLHGVANCASVEHHRVEFGPRGNRPAPTFSSFIQKFGRTYATDTAEYEIRKALYDERAQEIERLNRRPNRLWTAGINKLSDWTDAELRKLRGWRGVANKGRGRLHSSGQHNSGMSLRQTARAVAQPLAEDVDWSNLTASKTIHNQGSCGSCWAIATQHMLEANFEIAKGKYRSFSPQELVNCVPNRHHCGGSGGCDGATVELAMHYMTHHGLRTDDEVHYTAQDGKCDQTSLLEGLGDSDSDADFEALTMPGIHHVKATGEALPIFWERYPENEALPLARGLMGGPVAVSVAAAKWAWYNGGIFDFCDADAVIDHAVTAIGFGKDLTTGKKYWRIQNSWGGDWGENGRIRLLREELPENANDDERKKALHCGTDHQPEVGTGCDGGPATVPVCGMCGVLYDSVRATFGKVESA